MLRLYSKLIKLGDYFIVEDSICHHGIAFTSKPGPYEAIETFISENADFEIDRSREHFFLTWNPKGYLRRTMPSNKQQYIKQPKKVPLRERIKKSSVLEVLKLFIPPILIHIIRKLTNMT